VNLLIRHRVLYVDVDIQGAMTAICSSIGEIPISITEEAESVEEAVVKQPTQRILADGTYATETNIQSAPVTVKTTKLPLKALFCTGDYFVASALGTALVKLSLNYAKLADKKLSNAFTSKVNLC
jgi:hypothetical protein